jgi:tetratricopeptide (TPR) repeat protein
MPSPHALFRWAPCFRSRPTGAAPQGRALSYVLAGLAASGLALLAWWGYVRQWEEQLHDYQEEAYAARRVKDWNRVAELAATWAAREPDDAMPLLMLAEVAQEEGDLQKAADFLARLPSADPRTVRGLLERTNLLFGPLNQPFEGAETCKRIIRIEPANVEAWQRLNFFYAVTVQRVALARSTRATIRQGAGTPETYIYLVGADWLNLANGYEMASRWLQTDPENETLLVARAMNYIYSTNVHEEVFRDEAPHENRPYHEQILAEYFERFPKNLELLDFYLKQSTVAGDTARVAELLKQAPPDSAEDSRFWRHQGWLLATQGRLEEAENAFHKALELNPLDWRTLHELSGVVRQSGRLDEAKQQGSLAAEGKRLQKVIFELPNVQAVGPEVLAEMGDYLQRCGEVELAAGLIGERKRPR